MSTTRVAIAGVVVLLLVGCVRTYEVHEVDGVSDKFCVPRDRMVGRVSWIPASIPRGNGFSFSGCWRGDLKDQKGCPFPRFVIGGVTSSAASFRSQQWQDIDDESLIKRTINSVGASLEVIDKGRMVVAANTKTYWGWFVWRKIKPAEEARLEAGDELIATCQEKNVALPGTTTTRPALMCQRTVLGKDYALSYSFESEDRAPKDIEELDAQVFAGIDRWRCKK